LPRKEFRYYVYIVASASRVLYIGITSGLIARVGEHRRKAIAGFSAKYNCYRLMYYERFGSVQAAIVREKQLKRWRRGKKIALIESINPDWI
jgi:putative endonuclease